MCKSSHQNGGPKSNVVEFTLFIQTDSNATLPLLRRPEIKSVNEGKAIPEFTASITGDKQLQLSDLLGKQTVIYFYPRDSTPGCTTEGQDFRDQITAFTDVDTQIFGASRDSIKSHERFKEKQQFPFDLISDPDESFCKLFNVIKLKKLYGKEHMGIERSTFLIDKKGILQKEWRKVRVKGHVDEVLEAAQQLYSS